MSGAPFYPPADRTTQWFGGQYPGTVMSMSHPKLLLHTTETPGGWPAYAAGSVAPTLTYEPWAHQWRAHFKANQSARALRDPSDTPVRENRADVVQVEIAAYCDPAQAHTGKGIDKLDTQAYDDLGRFTAWLHLEWALPLQAQPVWLPYPKSYGPNNTVRMTSSEYESYSGILGHQHAPGNVHGDPGNLDVPRILERAHAHITRGSQVDQALRLLNHAHTDDLVARKHIHNAVRELTAIPARLI